MLLMLLLCCFAVVVGVVVAVVDVVAVVVVVDVDVVVAVVDVVVAVVDVVVDRHFVHLRIRRLKGGPFYIRPAQDVKEKLEEEREEEGEEGGGGEDGRMRTSMSCARIFFLSTWRANRARRQRRINLAS